MSKRGLIILVVAVLAVGLGAVAIASSMGGSDDEPATHVMPGGQTMEGEDMDDDSMGEMPTNQDQTPSGETMPGSDDSGMGDGSMDGMDMGN